MSPLRRTMHELPVSVIEVVDGAADNGHASAGAEPTLLPAPASQSRHLTLMAADVAVPSTPQIDPVGLGVEAQLLSPGFRTPADQIIRDPTRSASPPSPIANPAGRSPDGGARPASPLELPEPPMVRESASPTPLPPAAPRRSSSAASLRSAAIHNADDASGGDASGLLPIGDIGRVGHVADDGANVGSGVEVASLAASAAIDDDGDDDGANTTGIWLPRTPETGRGRGRPAGTPGSGPTMQEIEGRLAATAMADLQAATKAANPSPPRHTPQKQSRFDVDHEAFQYVAPARAVLTMCATETHVHAPRAYERARVSVTRLEDAVIEEVVALGRCASGSAHLLQLLHACASLRVMRRPRLAAAVDTAYRALVFMCVAGISVCALAPCTRRESDVVGCRFLCGGAQVSM